MFYVNRFLDVRYLLLNEGQDCEYYAEYNDLALAEEECSHDSMCFGVLDMDCYHDNYLALCFIGTIDIQAGDQCMYNKKGMS